MEKKFVLHELMVGHVIIMVGHVIIMFDHLPIVMDARPPGRKQDSRDFP